jgi:hypothetical protein
MRDLSINDLADEVRQELLDMGIFLEPKVVRGLTKQFFKYVEKRMERGDVNFQFWNKDVTQIFKHLDVSKLCEELAAGSTNMTYDYLLRKRKLSIKTIKYMRRRHKDTLSEEETVRLAMR